MGGKREAARNVVMVADPRHGPREVVEEDFAENDSAIAHLSFKRSAILCILAGGFAFACAQKSNTSTLALLRAANSS